MMNTMIITAIDIRRTWPADADRAIVVMPVDRITNCSYFL